MARASRSVFWTASLLFFLSGATGLAYEVIWFKRFAHVWGNSSLAMASVVASFLFGLGIGAQLVGVFADRVARPLRWYGVAEIAIGVLALIIPFEIQWLVANAAWLYATLPSAPTVQFLGQFLTTFAVIGPPCFLMGGTLPLLICQLTARDGSISESTGWLYAINTLGAAAGCYLTGFHLLPSLGLYQTGILAAATNIAIGALSVLLSLVLPVVRPQVASAEATGQTELHADEGAKISIWAIYMASFLTGSAALVLQMTWARQLATTLGGSTYAFTATVFVVLVSIAIGSLLFHLLLRRTTSLAYAPAVIIAVLTLSMVFGKWSVPALCQFVGRVASLRASQGMNALICVGASAVIELMPSIAMGLLFPLYIHLTRRSAAVAGRTVGSVYAFNTVGSLLGATLTSLVCIPILGVAGTLALAAGLYFIALLVTLPSFRPSGAPLAVLCVLLGVSVVLALAQPIDPRKTDMGMFLYGPQRPSEMQKHTVAMFDEGIYSNVLVLATGAHRTLRVNGKIDASNGGPDMPTQLGSAYLPRCFRPDARNVLVIGYGSGTTPGASLMFPDTKVVCCEIEPAVYRASKYFADINHEPEKHPNFEMVIGDGRMLVQTSKQQYDLIISEPSNPWLAGVSALFTQEFFESAKECLTEGGVLAQWLQTYKMAHEDYALIVRTLKSVFPHCSLLLLGQGGDAILLASEKPLLPSPADMDKVQAMAEASPEIMEDLKQHFVLTDMRRLLMSRCLLMDADLQRLVDSAGTNEINTDVNLKLEFDAPLYLFGDSLPEDRMAFNAIVSEVRPESITQFAKAIGINTNDVVFLNDMSNIFISLGRFDDAAQQLVAAAKIKPELIDVYRQTGISMAQRHIFSGSVVSLRAVLGIEPEDAQAHALLGQILVTNKHAAEGAHHLRESLRIEPKQPEVAMWLAWVLATNVDDSVRDGTEAVRLAREACEFTNYREPSYLETLAAAYAEKGRYDEAIRITEEAGKLAEENDQIDLADSIRSKLRYYRTQQPFREE